MRRISILLLFLLLATIFCQKKKEDVQTGEIGQEEQAGISDSTFLTIKPKAINYDSMFVILNQLSQAIRENPADTLLRKALVKAGYDTTWETVMAVGVSEPIDSTKSESLAIRLAEQAAKADAYRWCAYIKKWHDNLNFNDFGKIQADFTGARVVKTKRLPDNRIAVLVEMKSQLIQ